MFHVSQYKNEISIQVIKRIGDMASTSNGWTVISTKVESDELIADSETKTKSINDYYEETGDLERKCRLCATIVKIAKTTKWNLKQHFKKRHPIEWASEFEPFLRTVQAKVCYQQSLQFNHS